MSFLSVYDCAVVKMQYCPIEKTSDEIHRQLCCCLWSWVFCTECPAKKCSNQVCAHQRFPGLKRYFQFYTVAIYHYTTCSPPEKRVLKQHGDVFEAVSRLRNNPQVTRLEFERFLAHSGADPNDIQPAATFAVQVLTMLDSSGAHDSLNRIEQGLFRLPWRGNVPFSQYLEDSFPIQSNSQLSNPDSVLLEDLKSDLRATELVSRIGLKFQRTHDVHDHLRFDPHQNELKIFHFTAFIKEHLRATKDIQDASNLSCSIAL